MAVTISDSEELRSRNLPQSKIRFSSEFKGRDNDWIALFSISNLTYTPFMYFNQTYMVYRAFAELLESRKKFQKSSHGRKLSEKCHKKVNAL